MQGACVWSLVRELDPMCRNQDPVQPNKGIFFFKFEKILYIALVYLKGSLFCGKNIITYCWFFVFFLHLLFFNSLPASPGLFLFIACCGKTAKKTFLIEWALVQIVAFKGIRSLLLEVEFGNTLF